MAADTACRDSAGRSASSGRAARSISSRDRSYRISGRRANQQVGPPHGAAAIQQIPQACLPVQALQEHLPGAEVHLANEQRPLAPELFEDRTRDGDLKGRQATPYWGRPRRGLTPFPPTSARPWPSSRTWSA